MSLLKRVPVTSSPSSQIGVSVTLLSLLFAGLLFNGGCKESSADKVADAQECLDRYAREGGDLALCEAYVAGMTTPPAHGIRCASGFIKEGFSSAQTFIDAFSAISTVNATSVQNFLMLITFDSAGNSTQGVVNANYANAQKVYGSCAASLAKGATMISTFSYLTNVLYKYECDNLPASGFMGSCVMDGTALAAAILVGATDPSGSTDSMKVDLGTIVVNTNTVSCSTGAANEKLCEFLSTAITNAGGPNNKALVGEEFLNVLQNPPP
jgi:hypothetical protein